MLFYYLFFYSITDFIFLTKKYFSAKNVAIFYIEIYFQIKNATIYLLKFISTINLQHILRR